MYHLETERADTSHLFKRSPVDVLSRDDSSGLLLFNKIVLVSEPTDLRAGMDTLRTKAIRLTGEVAPHEGYVFMNRTQTLLKLVVHDAMGTWLVLSAFA